jgi:ATP-dependent Clp protease ATP-binding subunit ClpB
VVTLDPSAREWLADKGYDPAYGARPLKRVIQRELQDPLAEKILAGDVKDGDGVTVSAGKLENGADRLIFEVAPGHREEAGAEQAAA